MKNYLPSKKFTYGIAILVIVGIAIFTLSSYFSKRSKYIAENNTKLEAGKLTINNLLQKDTDIDGVMDWEEALWGTNPNKQATFDDVPDATYIKNKRAELKISDGVGTEDGKDLTETDKFAQEFFASILAMKQNGQIDSNTINNVSAALGQRIADPTIIDKYTVSNIKTNKKDDSTSREDYYLKVKTLFDKYRTNGIGEELGIVGGVATAEKDNADAASVSRLSEIANAYQEFAQKMLIISVPESLATFHLKIANNANNTGVSVQNMTKINEDPIVGLSGLSQYKKYSDDLVSSVAELEATLSNN